MKWVSSIKKKVFYLYVKDFFKIFIGEIDILNPHRIRNNTVGEK